MKAKFNRFEKVAGLFVVVALVAFLAGAIGIAVKNGWFEAKVRYTATLSSADGVYPGTAVQMAGLHAGSVTSVDLVDQGDVKVHFQVFEKFAQQIKKDSVVQVFRPFIIGEKVLAVSVGSKEEPRLAANSEIKLQPTMDLMDLLSGREMSSFLGSFDKMADSLKILTKAFSDPKRTQALIRAFDRIDPLLRHLNRMSVEVSQVTSIALKKKRMEIMMSSLSQLSQQLNTILPEVTKEVPNVGTQMGQLVKNMNSLSSEFQKLSPAIDTLAPQLPKTTARAVEALDQAVILLKGMQRSFLFRGGVEDVREEESRLPASSKK